jgi:hypothetical protein
MLEDITLPFLVFEETLAELLGFMIFFFFFFLLFIKEYINVSAQ